MIWFTSDTHFGHANVLDFCERPWDTIEAMNDALVDAINECVAPTDTLYHLGDFSFKMTVDAARELRAGACVSVRSKGRDMKGTLVAIERRTDGARCRVAIQKGPRSCMHVTAGEGDVRPTREED